MQKLVTSVSRENFEKTVNDMLQRGWTAVPATLVMAVSNADRFGKEAYGIVLQKDEPEYGAYDPRSP